MGGQAAAADDRWCFPCDLEEERGVVGVENVGECWSIDKQHLLCVVVLKKSLSEDEFIISSDFVDLLVDALESCTDGDALGSFYLVASEHPNFDAAHAQCLDGNGHFILKLVLNTCNSDQIHLFLQFFHHFLRLNVSVLQ